MHNPFAVWAQLARALKERFLADLGNEPFSPYTSELLGVMAALITQCEHLGESFKRLHDKDARAYEAFLRALEKS